MDFPHAGDLMVISTVYPDGTVAALEGLIGNHGGLGGEQTDAFLFHPPDLVVPPTRNAIDVFHILNGRRNQPVAVAAAGAPAAAEPAVGAWSLANLWGGLRDVRAWLPLAGRALMLDPFAYQAAVADQRITAPALLLGPVLLAIYVLARGESPAVVPIQVAIWFLGVLAIYAARWSRRHHPPRVTPPARHGPPQSPRWKPPLARPARPASAAPSSMTG